jgi:hypothetical protein
MEHHLLQKGSSSINISVPYVCTEPYESETWFGYAIKKGYPELGRPADDNYGDFIMKKSRLTYNTKDQEILYQTWLFFGLSRVFFGPDYKDEDFIRTADDGTKWITTTLLIPYMQRAWDARSGWSNQDLATRFLAAERCVKHIHYLLRIANKDFDWRIKISITSVTELIAMAITKAFGLLGIKETYASLMQAPIIGDFPQPEIKFKMLSQGWCPSEIAPLTEKFRYLQSLVFLSSIDRSELNRDHSKCTTALCNSFQINPAEYETKHVLTGCTCSKVSIDVDTVYRILQSGKIPLLSITDIDGNAQIEILPSGEGLSYVSISHVWADGLGDPHQNSLPNCQILRLGQLLTSLSSEVSQSSNNNADQKLHLWIDTLCCPVRPEAARHLAISLLAQVYLEADHVLVLDAGIQKQNRADLELYHAAISIFISSWTRRLWTLQEGILPRRLWFQFKDRPVDAKDLYNEIQKAVFLDVRLYCIQYDLFMNYVSLREARGYRGDRHEVQLGEALYKLDFALQYRSCSLAADEPICISTLLNLPLESIVSAGQDLDSRMARVWELIDKKFGGIPQAAVLVSLPKIQLPGFGWAPKSLLTDVSLFERMTKVEYRHMMWYDSKLGRVTPNGLVCQWSGFHVRLKSASIRPLLLKLWPVLEQPSLGIGWVEKDNGETLAVTAYQEAGDVFGHRIENEQVTASSISIFSDLFLKSQDCAVIETTRHASITQTGTKQEIGLVGLVTNRDVDMVYFHPTTIAIVTTIDPSWSAIEETTRELKNTVKDLPEIANLQIPDSEEAVKELAKSLDKEIAKISERKLKNQPQLYSAMDQIWPDDTEDGLVKILVYLVKHRIYFDLSGETCDEQTKWCIG